MNKLLKIAEEIAEVTPRGVTSALILLIGVFLFSCEKRVPLDTPFSFEEDRLFCEVIGIPGEGFFGTITQIRPVEPSNQVHEVINVIIRENGVVVIDTDLYQDFTFLPFPVNTALPYSIEVNYKSQTITSKYEKWANNFLPLENLVCVNQFVDSLGFHVAETAFEVTAPDDFSGPFYYTYNFELSNAFPIFNNIIEAEEAVKIEAGTTEFVSKRIPNQANFQQARILLLSIDQDLFQYLKNIKRLGQIPNDEIEGHQGNLDGGIGYFGIVNYDVRVVQF